MILLNLIPLLELDGYWILSDLIQVPDLRPRSLAFIRATSRTSSGRANDSRRRSSGSGLYGVIGIVFTILSLYTAYFFWRQMFGGLVSALWNGGVVSRAPAVLLGAVPGRPGRCRAAISLGRVIGRRIRAIGAGSVFACRVEVARGGRGADRRAPGVR